jgi:hypothetical protein
LRAPRPHQPSGEQQSFGRAKLGVATVVLLAVLRCYALFGVAIAVYAFFRAIQ